MFAFSSINLVTANNWPHSQATIRGVSPQMSCIDGEIMFIICTCNYTIHKQLIMLITLIIFSKSGINVGIYIKIIKLII